MTDLSMTIAPKSDQLTADDLLGGPRTIEISSVSLTAEPDQPIAIGFVDDNGRPYKPCKSMRRALVTVWGPDGNTYPGRKMTLFHDPDVRYGGMAVGGIRISHMSHITRPITMALTETRSKKKPYTVQPLVEAKQDTPGQIRVDEVGGYSHHEPARQSRVDESKIDAKVEELAAKFAETDSLVAHHRLITDKEVSKTIEWLKKARPERYSYLLPFIKASHERNKIAPPSEEPQASFDEAVEIAS